MASLLTIPIDIRICIIENVLLAASPAQSDVQTSSESRYQPEPHSALLNIGRDFVRYTSGPVLPNSVGLLLSNRQLSRDTVETIAHLQAADRLEYQLNVLIVDDCELWPTWICVPATVPVIPRIWVKFRVIGARRRNARSAYLYNASPRIIMYGFYYLLQHFLLVAPGRGAIGSLILDFCDEDPNENFQPDADEALRDAWAANHDQHPDELPEGIASIVPRASWIGNLVNANVNACLSMDYHTSYYGALIYERVGEIKVLARPVAEHIHDLGQAFAALSFTDPSMTFGHVPRDTRIARFWQWKETAREMRLKFGLPVAGAGESPLAEEPQPDKEHDTSSDHITGRHLPRILQPAWSLFRRSIRLVKKKAFCHG